MQSDEHAAAALRFAFEREGIQVASLSGAEYVPDALSEPAGLVVFGASSKEAATTGLAAVRKAVDQARAGVPLLYVGNAIGRTQALAEGANEFVGQPTYVRDVVTVARLLAARKPDAPHILTGELRDHFGMFYIVRAVVTSRRRGVLTLVRGLRRGELRFYDGEVTSAQVSVLHGLAALHQLLLWTEGRFELRPENVVRRRQIPLDPPELIADAERFLAETRQVADRLSPTALYERVTERAVSLPAQVELVWRLFDGTRTLADVIEDSPFRMFETLQIGNELAGQGLLRPSTQSRPVRRHHAALAIEEWLGGGAVERETSGVPAAVDWSRLVPQAAAELPSPPSIVPSTVAAGEISARPEPSRRDELAVPAPVREGIEAVAGVAALQGLFTAAEAIDDSRTVPFERVALEPDEDEETTGKVARLEVAAIGVAGAVQVAEIPVAATGEIVARSRPTGSMPPPVEEPAVVIADEAPPEVSSPAVVADSPPAVSVAVSPPAVSVAVSPPAVSVAVSPSAVRVAVSSPAVSVAVSPPAVGVAVDTLPAGLELPAPEQLRATATPPEPAPVLLAAAPSPSVPAADVSTETRQFVRVALDEVAPPARTPARKPTEPGPTGDGRAEMDRMIRSADTVFSADEEAFFAAGHELAGALPAAESFDDLDDAYEMPQTFWQRFLRKPGAPLHKKKRR